ncbi:MAG: ECF transporter S component [Candidatus Bathyarchaeota archaeon]|nr:ECF transporter S component [Candidatus Bathyarchaeota archaeon]
MSQVVNQQKAVIQISLMAVMSALVAIGTFVVQIPNGMGGYFNVGDAMIFVAALTFNPLVSGVAGGLGSAIADLPGYVVYAPATLVIKGLEGLLAGFITNKKSVFRDVIAVTVAGVTMIFGYFLFEVYLLGAGQAIAGIPLNAAQILVSALIGVPVALVLRRRMPEIFRN